MQIITLNIGLLNNPFSNGKATGTYFNDILNVIRFQFPSESEIDFRFENGTYNGEVEPTLIVRIETDDELTTSQTKTICCNLCQFFTQECISFTSGEYNSLVYNREYSGTKFEFDPRYFINWVE